MAGLPHRFERRPGRVIAATGVTMAAAYSLAIVLLPRPSGRLVAGDAIHHYVQLRSIVFDGDLHFLNDYQGLETGRALADRDGEEWLEQRTVTGHVPNLMPVGPALFWAPLFLVATAVAGILTTLGVDYPVDGFGWLFQGTAAYSGIAAATTGAWLAYRMTAGLYGSPTALAATVGVWLGSHALYYSLVSPTYSHAVSMLTASAFFLLWSSTRGSQTPRRYAAVGLAGGIAALVRWQDAVFLLAPALEAVLPAARGRPEDADGPARRHPAGRSGAVQAIRRLAACAAGAVVGFAPQMAVWLTLYGSPLAMPQGDRFMRWTSPQVVAVLFSDFHGLFTWTPLLAIAVVGLFLVPRRWLVIGSGAVVVFVASVYVNAAVVDWWAGEAYGSRRFLSCFPLFVLGLGAAIDRVTSARPMRWAVGALVALNFLLLLQYQTFMHGWRDLAPYPRGLYGLVVARFVVPFEILARLFGS
jgi:hypothetical protein